MNEGFGVVFDTVGGQNLPPSLEAAARWGQVVTTTADQDLQMRQLLYKALILHVVFKLVPLISGKRRGHHGEILRQLAALVEAGRLRPLVDDTRFGVSEVASATLIWRVAGLRARWFWKQTSGFNAPVEMHLSL